MPNYQNTKAIKLSESAAAKYERAGLLEAQAAKLREMADAQVKQADALEAREKGR